MTATPAEAADGAGVVLTMLSDSDAVISAVTGENGALAALADPAVWLQMSTIGEEGTERCARLAQERGIGFVDAPVLGTKGPAEQGTLSVVEAGAEAIALAEGLGLDPALLFEALDGGPLDVPYLRTKGQAMVDRSFEPSFRLGLAAKDAGLVEQAAAQRGLDLPLHRVISERMAQAPSSTAIRT